MGGRPGEAGKAINSRAFLVLICGSGTTGDHGLVTEGKYPNARALGLTIPTNSTVDPATVPIFHAVYGWCLLDHQGNVTPLPDYKPEVVA
ncbi:hypothetical protein ABN028_19470 [Actinopolymorpha sp. B17G11]|uniref:hypothetical protein n=1 Tax=Actinopolymorpha sp. B17G11 TaxID=3160861 RepID=UPI0032E53095